LINFLALLLSSAQAFAQEPANAYPSRPVTIIIPLTPGGGGDLESRLYNQKLTESLGKPFLNDYKPGAGTTIGTAYVAKAKPDGYTLLAISPTFTIAPAFYPDLTYEVNRDFTAIAQMSKRVSMLAITPSFPARNMADFIAYAKAHPGEINWGTHGAGSASHLCGAWLQGLTNTKFTFVHYKGSSPLTVDVMAGRAHATVIVLSSTLQHLKAGKIRTLGISGTERTSLLPGVPTVQEQGVPEFEYPSWLGIFGPAGLSPEIVAKLNSELAKAARHLDVVKALGVDGSIGVGGSADQLRRLVATESMRWKTLAKDSGIRLEE